MIHVMTYGIVSLLNGKQAFSLNIPGSDNTFQQAC